MIATWFDAQRQPLSEAFHFIQRRDPVPAGHVTVETSAQSWDDGTYRVTLCSDSFLQAVNVQAAGFLPSDNFFHLVPQRIKQLVLSPLQGSTKFQAEYQALNLAESRSIPFVLPGA